MKTASWVIIEIESKTPVLETFNKNVVNNLNNKKYTAIPILEYLCKLNNQIKHNVSQQCEKQ